MNTVDEKRHEQQYPIRGATVCHDGAHHEFNKAYLNSYIL